MLWTLTESKHKNPCGNRGSADTLRLGAKGNINLKFHHYGKDQWGQKKSVRSPTQTEWQKGKTSL